MSYEICKSISVKRDKITITSHCNNVRPFIDETWSITRTTDHMRQFIKSLVGGDLQPTPSCGDYFWVQAIKTLVDNGIIWEGEPTNHDRGIELLMHLLDARKDNSKHDCVLYCEGHGYYTGHKNGKLWFNWVYENGKKMNIYEANYLKEKYNFINLIVKQSK